MSDSGNPLHRAGQALQTAQQAQRTVEQAQRAAQQVRNVARGKASAQEVASAVGSVSGMVPGPVGEVLGALSDVVASAVNGLRPVEKVRFSFHSDGDPGAVWRVTELHATEGLCELYTCTLNLANEILGADPDALLGESCEVLLAREATTRRLCGIVHRVEHLGTKGGHLLARVHVVPALWALSQRRDSYIFQERTVPEILQEVLKEGLGPFERTVRMEGLDREYKPREYCVQYRETDLDFVLRLMEEEGISFYFDHSGATEELVLFELNEQCTPCETADGEPLRIAGPEASTAAMETLRSFDFVHALQPTSVVVHDFDWTRPGVDLKRESRGEDLRGRERELYEYPVPRTGPYDKQAKAYTLEDTRRDEQFRRQAYKVQEKRGVGQSTVTGFSPGRMFELTGHGRSELDQWYLLTRVEHFGHAPEELTSDTHEDQRAGVTEERYFNRFEGIPLDVPFRPLPRRSRARMAGLQTATVVGPSNEAIHTDEHGRIKVQFHWDRAGQRDDKASCFLRVAQTWAGSGWGFVFIPRVGMEVLVDFLEGDPDRPLVVGCVYNGHNTPPYPLPDHKTRSTIRTTSVPASSIQERNTAPRSEGFNELRFEDAEDHEEVFLHAQKDFNEVVLHNHSTQVKANQSNTVDGSQSESVGGDQSMTVTGKRTKTVKQDEKNTVEGARTHEVTGLEKHTLHNSREITIDQDDTLTVTGKTTEKLHGGREVKVEQFDNTTVEGANKNTTVHGQYNIVADEHFKITQGANQLFIKEQLYAESSGDIQFKNGGCHATLGNNGTFTLQVNNEVVIQCGSATLHLKSDGTVELVGTKVMVGNATNNAAFEPAGTTINGTQVTSQAVGIHTIAGALIKIG